MHTHHKYDKQVQEEKPVPVEIIHWFITDQWGWKIAGAAVYIAVVFALGYAIDNGGL